MQCDTKSEQAKLQPLSIAVVAAKCAGEAQRQATHRSLQPALRGCILPDLNIGLPIDHALDKLVKLKTRTYRRPSPEKTGRPRALQTANLQPESHLKARTEALGGGLGPGGLPIAVPEGPVPGGQAHAHDFGALKSSCGHARMQVLLA